jgi:predicted aldo/keto reductase-like oxidoreductase
LIRRANDIERIFNNELKNLQTDYIDYYLMHMLSNKITWDRLCKLGIEEWIEEKKRSGKIRNIGFSFHGGKEDFVRIIDAYNWEFTQIQYNYLDENNQAGRSGLEYAAKKGLPVIVMEPLRGGRLVTGLPDDVQEIFASYTPKHKPADWALRWLFDHPEVTCVLSGMATMEQLDENIATANEADVHGLSENEKDLFRGIKRSIFEKTKVPCTGCHYCMPCPVGVDIPNCFAVYNDGYLHSMRKARNQYLQATGALTGNPGYASRCIGCGKCESICPQAIPIRKSLKDGVREMERFPFRQAMWIARKFVHEKQDI